MTKKNTYSNEFCNLYTGKQGITHIAMWAGGNNSSTFLYINENLNYHKQSSLHRHNPEGYKRP